MPKVEVYDCELCDAREIGTVCIATERICCVRITGRCFNWIQNAMRLARAAGMAGSRV